MIKISLLKTIPEAIPSLAQMWHKLLGRIWVPDISIELVRTRFHEHLNDDVLPLTLVALDNENPIGMCSLRQTDGIREELTPWLGSLVVSESYQNRGIAKLLMDNIKDMARDKGFKELYLFTFDPTLPAYYQRHGWKNIGTDILKSHPVTIMSISL